MIERGAFPAEYDVAAGAAGFLVTEAGEERQRTLHDLVGKGVVEIINATATHTTWRLTVAGVRQLSLAVTAKGRYFLRAVALERVANTPWMELTTFELFAALRSQKFEIKVLGCQGKSAQVDCLQW